MKNKLRIHITHTPLYLLILFSFLLSSCEKDIEVKLPDVEQKIVIEGYVEPGLPPFVIISKSIGYFEPTDINTFENLFVHNAVVTVSNGSYTASLPELCTGSIPDSLLPFVADFIGISPEMLSAWNYCIYIAFDPLIIGQVGYTYDLTVKVDGETYTSSTKIPELIPLDSVWFKLEPTYDSLGFVWAHFADPDTTGNYYRWFTKVLGEDTKFIPPMGSVFDDKFFNGKEFDFFYDRGHYPNAPVAEDHTFEDHYFRLGDTVVVRYCTLDKGHYEFWRSFETEAVTSGNPFASPSTIKTNINGGCLGVWGGYGATYDTLIAQ